MMNTRTEEIDSLNKRLEYALIGQVIRLII